MWKYTIHQRFKYSWVNGTYANITNQTKILTILRQIKRNFHCCIAQLDLIVL